MYLRSLLGNGCIKQSSQGEVIVQYCVDRIFKMAVTAIQSIKIRLWEIEQKIFAQKLQSTLCMTIGTKGEIRGCKSYDGQKNRKQRSTKHYTENYDKAI